MSANITLINNNTRQMKINYNAVLQLIIILIVPIIRKPFPSLGNHNQVGVSVMMNWHLIFLNLTYLISLLLMAAVNLGSFSLEI